MNNICSRDLGKCYGCSACYSACPRGAISMAMDDKGFYKPVVDSSKCIDCGLCLKACIIGRGHELISPSIMCVGVKHKSKEIIKNSTSGGAFALFAEEMLDVGGTIVACALIENRAVHVESQDFAMFHGSKYVQSDLQNAFKTVYNTLLAKRKILFVGTPCQCAGLRSFLSIKRVDTSDLLVMDFICHGTPSAGLFSDYIKYIEKKYKSPVVGHRFRTKYLGWQSQHIEENIFANGTQDHESYDSQVFKGLFYSSLAMNNSCYQCEYATLDRVSDITIADFWGVKESHPEFWDNDGVSFVMINSETGTKWFDKVKDKCDYIPVNRNDTKQPHLLHVLQRPKATDKFWEEYKNKGFKYVIYKYCHAGPIRRGVSDTLRKLFSVEKKRG